MKHCKYLIMIILGLFLVSCGTKPSVTKEIQIENALKETSTVDTVLVVNNAIIDSLLFTIPILSTVKPECDSLLNARVQALFSQINTIKRSGNNELGFVYDQLNKQLIAYGKLEQTINSRIENKETFHTKQIQIEKEEIPVKYTPKYMKVLAILGALFILFLGYRFSLIFRK